LESGDYEIDDSRDDLGLGASRPARPVSRRQFLGRTLS